MEVVDFIYLCYIHHENDDTNTIYCITFAALILYMIMEFVAFISK